MENIFAGVLKGVNSANETFFIHLDAVEKVLLYTTEKKIILVQDLLTSNDVKYVAKMQKEGKISKDAFNKIKERFDSQSKRKEVTDGYEEIEQYLKKQVSFVELIYAIHNYYVPKAEIINYAFYRGDELEEHSIKYTK